MHVCGTSSRAAAEKETHKNIPNTATKFSKLLASRFDLRTVSNETMPLFSEKMSEVGLVTLAAGGVQPAASSTDILRLRTLLRLCWMMECNAKVSWSQSFASDPNIAKVFCRCAQ